MSHVRQGTHIIFSTKNREPLLSSEFQDRLFEFIGGIVRSCNSTLIAAGGHRDHIHLLVLLHQSIALADLVRDVKSRSSSWMNEEHLVPGRFRWQTKYGGFAVSASNEEKVTAYINNQEEHHRELSFQEELEAFLTKHGVKFDPKYHLE